MTMRGVARTPLALIVRVMTIGVANALPFDTRMVTMSESAPVDAMALISANASTAMGIAFPQSAKVPDALTIADASPASIVVAIFAALYFARSSSPIRL